MQITLTIAGSASSLASVLALLAANEGNAETLPTGTANDGAASSPFVSAQMQPVPVAFNPSVATAIDDDDESGDAAAAIGALDKEGLPWDARIHSTKPTMTKKGLWRKQRGVNDAFVAQIEAELRAGVATMQPVAVAQPVPVTMPQYQPQPDNAPHPVAVAQPVQQFQPQPVATFPTDFNAFLAHVSTKMNEKDASGIPLISSEYLNNVAQRVGAAQVPPVAIATITDIGMQPHLIPIVANLMHHEGRW